MEQIRIKENPNHNATSDDTGRDDILPIMPKDPQADQPMQTGDLDPLPLTLHSAQEENQHSFFQLYPPAQPEHYNFTFNNPIPRKSPGKINNIDGLNKPPPSYDYLCTDFDAKIQNHVKKVSSAVQYVRTNLYKTSPLKQSDNVNAIPLDSQTNIDALIKEMVLAAEQAVAALAVSVGVITVPLQVMTLIIVLIQMGVLLIQMVSAFQQY